MRADSAAAPGTLKIFLHGGTLLMTSCGEPHQLARWQAVGDSAVSWDEGTRTIRAVVDAIADDSLTLRLAVVLDRREDPFMASETIERFRKATVPFVCPDLPR